MYMVMNSYKVVEVYTIKLFHQTRFPAELEGRISEEQFLFTVNMMNKMYAEAEKVSTKSKGGCTKSPKKTWQLLENRPTARPSARAAWPASAPTSSTSAPRLTTRSACARSPDSSLTKYVGFWDFYLKSLLCLDFMALALAVLPHHMWKYHQTFYKTFRTSWLPRP